MSFQSSLEMFQCQFWICIVFGQGFPHSRSGDTEASWPEATFPGSRCGDQVSPCRRTKVGSRPDFRNRDEMQDRLRYVGPRPWSVFRTKVAILKMMPLHGIVVPHVQNALYFWLQVRALKRTLLYERSERTSRFSSFFLFEMWIDFYLAFMSTMNCIAFLSSNFELLAIS